MITYVVLTVIWSIIIISLGHYFFKYMVSTLTKPKIIINSKIDHEILKCLLPSVTIPKVPDAPSSEIPNYATPEKSIESKAPPVVDMENELMSYMDSLIN